MPGQHLRARQRILDKITVIRLDHSSQGLWGRRRQNKRQTDLVFIRNAVGASVLAQVKRRPESFRNRVVDLRNVLLNDGVRVGASEPERVDASTLRLASGDVGPGDRRSRDEQVGAVLLDVGVELVEMKIRRHQAVAHALNHLEKTRQTGCALCVADDGLDRADQELGLRVGFLVATEECVLNGTRFVGVTGAGACAVGLEVLAAIFSCMRVQTGALIGVLNEA